MQNRTRPWLKEWEKEIALRLERADVASAKTRQRGGRTLRDFLEKLRAFTVLDPACGSGNFLYLALHALKDWSTASNSKPSRWACSAPSPPSAPPVIEINPYAAELARVSVWI